MPQVQPLIYPGFIREPATPLGQLRARAGASFAVQGWPTRHVEAWKFTDLRRLAERRFDAPPAAADAGALGLPADAGRPRLVVANGRYRPDLSSVPEGVEIVPLDGEFDPAILALLEQVDMTDRPMLALNTARFEGGLLLRVPGGTAVDGIVDLIFAAGPGAVAAHPRVLVVLGPGARLTLAESHAAPAGAGVLSIPVVQVALAAGAALAHLRRQALGGGSTHLATTLVEAAEGALYDSFELMTGADLARSETVVRLAGRNAECRMHGVYLGRGSQHLDTTTLIDHAVPDCRSREVYKGVLDDKAHGVFQGKILVRRDAQRTDGYQLNRALLLSRGAEIDAKPELEIYADDVKCSHGATAGALDEEALFYLRARGIGAVEARAMLVDAFIREIVETIADPGLRAGIEAETAAWLADGRAA